MANMGRGHRLRIGILTQALVPLALGTLVVVATATIVVWRLDTGRERDGVLTRLSQRSESRAYAGQPTFDRVDRQIHACRDAMVRRWARQDGRVALPEPQLDGTIRLLPAAGDPPVAVFVSERSVASPDEVRAAALARDLLIDLGPAMAQDPPDLVIAASGRWLVGWGTDACELVDAMLPDDPVLLPAELEIVGEPGPVRWSRAFVEPASGDRRVVAATTADLPGVGRIAVTQILPVDGILAQATSGDATDSDTVVFDADGRILASTRASAGATLTGSDDPLLRAIAARVKVHGARHELLALPEADGQLGIARFPGPDWVVATFHPELGIAAQTAGSAWYAIVLGGSLVTAQTLLLLVVLRQRVARPLQQLARAAAALTSGRKDIDLPRGRDDEVGELSTAFATMSAAVASREAELRSTAEALREREELASAMVASAADAVMIIVGQRIVEANPRAGTLFATEASVLLGRSLEDLSPDRQADGQESRMTLPALLARASQGEVLHFSWRHRRPAGSEFDAEIGLARIELPGEPRLVAVVRDVTERNQMEQRLRQGQKLESLGRLAGGIAHDFNNLLAGIIGSAELMRLNPDNERQQQLTGVVLNAAGRAAQLTRKLLTFARKDRAVAVVYDVHQVLHEAKALLDSSLEKRIRISVETTAEHALVLGDAAQMENALINLGVNARDAMPHGGSITMTTRTVDLDAETAAQQGITVVPGRFIEISVRDSGSGIPDDILPRIFEPFFTTKDVGQGTGLGLAAVWGTLREHRGSIAVESTLGAGTVFRLILPLAPSGPAPDPVQRVIERREERGTVLLIDDEELVRLSTRQLLEALGWAVVEANDGYHGVEVFARLMDQVDLAMVDMEMPRLRGADCLMELRRLRPGLKAVLCSGYNREGTQADEFDAVLCKPYNLARLAQVLDEVMECR